MAPRAVNPPAGSPPAGIRGAEARSAAGSDRRKSHAAAHVDAAGPAIVLVRPQLGENIGAAARAMLNCGLSDLRLVRPRDGWPNVKALGAAAGAHDVLANVRPCESVADALADLHLVYATTARAREMEKPVVPPRAAAGAMREAAARGERVGLLFGPEKAGLKNEELVMADALVRIPLNPAFASLNLAQAVLLLSYEWYAAAAPAPPAAPPDRRSRPATKGELGDFFATLEGALDARGFYPTPEMRPKMARNMRTLFARIAPTRQDVQTLYGMVRALSADPARRPASPPRSD